MQQQLRSILQEVIFEISGESISLMLERSVQKDLERFFLINIKPPLQIPREKDSNCFSVG